MSGLLSMKLEGVDEAAKRLDSADRKIRKRVVRKAVRAGAAPYVKAVKRDAPVDTRELKKSLTQKVKSYRSGATIVSVVGARNRRSPSGRNPAKYLHLVEGGTRPHVIRTRTAAALSLGRNAFVKEVRHPGTKATRFMATTATSRRSEMVNAFSSKMKEETERELAKQ